MNLDATLRNSLSRYIAADLLDKLPDVDALAEVIRHLNGLHRDISSFLPLYIADDEELLTKDTGFLRPGTFLFADVSGFTALSEKLQTHGASEGAETLTLVINDYFSTMLEILAKSDGQLLKFAGDALLAFFPAENDEDASKAIRTGLRMQRAMAASFQPIRTPALTQLIGEHDQRLTMSIGISQGKLFEALVGNAIQRDHIIQGDLPGRAMNAEAAGDKDDVIIDAALQAQFANVFQTEPVEAGFFKVIDNLGSQLDDYEFHTPSRRRAKSSAIFDFDQSGLVEQLRSQLERVEKVSRFMAPEILNGLVRGGGHIPSENRIVITMFVHLTGFADILQAWGDDHLALVISILDRYYSIVQRIITTKGGTLTRSDPYQRGTKLLITFGAPVSNPDDPDRAIATALEMNRQLEEFHVRLQDELPPEMRRALSISQRMGITMGPVYAGEVGWKARREYTVMGDDVNLAARLMANAKFGQVLISGRIWERVSGHFETEAIEPLKLKGKSKPVPAYIVKSAAAKRVGLPSTSNTPFVGQEALMSMLKFVLEQTLKTRRRRVLALSGDAGVGKTRIAKEIAQMAEREGFFVAWASCALQSERKTTWASIVWQLLQFDHATDGAAQRQILKARLEELGLSELEPVFADLLSELMMPAEQAVTTVAAAKPQLADIFKLAERVNPQDMKKSGLFGVARRQISASDGQVETVLDDSDLWNKANIRTSLAEAVALFLGAFAHQRPTLIVIDDIHRENPQALQILQRAMEELAPMHLTILLTHEPSDNLNVAPQAFSVHDLREEETYTMAAHILRAADLGPRLKELVWTRTSGRPLFIESLLQTLVDTGQVERIGDRSELLSTSDSEAVPDDVRNIVISRIDRMDATTQVVLRAAAVLGESVHLKTLQVLSKVDDETTLKAILHELTRDQILEEDASHHYHFRHGMTQKAIYDSLPRIARQKLHRAAAEYWLTQPDWRQHPIAVAHHWLKGGVPTRALEIVTEVAEQAEKQRDYDYAIGLYIHALDLFPTEKSIQTQIDRLQKLSKLTRGESG